jgi:HK97 family phage prohead protease
MKLKHIKVEFKAVGDAGSFTGYAAVFNNVDLGGDIIAPGAFSKTIKEKADTPILWGHNPREVIGVNMSYREDAKGLYVEGQLVLDVQRAKEAHALMKAGAVKGMSIGYDTVVDEYNRETQVRTLKELKLWEYSLTPFPMNPEAQVLGVKNMEELKVEFHALLAWAARQKSPVSAEVSALIDETVSALQAAKALGPPCKTFPRRILSTRG